MTQKSSGSKTVTTVPSLCPHCKMFTSKAPKWVTLLAIMGNGKSRRQNWQNRLTLKETLGWTPSRVEGAIGAALAAGAVEPVCRGAGTYKATKQGQLFLWLWRKAGWDLAGTNEWKAQSTLRRAHVTKRA